MKRTVSPAAYLALVLGVGLYTLLLTLGAPGVGPFERNVAVGLNLLTVNSVLHILQVQVS